MRFIRNLFAIIFTIIFTITLTFGIFAFSIDSFLTTDALVETLDNIDYLTLIDYENDDNIRISETFLEVPEVKDVVDRIMQETFDYLLDDKKAPLITDADIDSIVNSNYYQEALGVILTDEEKAIFITELRENYNSFNERFEKDLIVIKNELYEEPVLKLILSVYFIPAIFFSLIILLVLIAMFRWNLIQTVLSVSIAVIIASGLNISANALLKPYILYKAADILEEELILDLLNQWFNNSIIALLIAIVLLLIYFILNKFNASREDKLIDSF